MRGAAVLTFYVYLLSNISTHAPHARRGEDTLESGYADANFYSRASCEARHTQIIVRSHRDKISTHAPHARRGLHIWYRRGNEQKFLLTRLMRGAALSEDLF